MKREQVKNPLHGITLQAIVEDLVTRRGWEDLAPHVRINCFSSDSSVKSSLKFLRKTFRYKLIIGDRLRARHPGSQKVEALIACNILNQMLALGGPE